MRKRKKCAICGEVGELSVDHIPPSCLFPKPLPNNMITVKACTKCNGGNSNDDEYFRALLVIREDSGSESFKLWDTVARSITKPEAQGFRNSMLRSFIPIERKSPAGIYLGLRPGIQVDANRVTAIISKCIRGLYFHRFKARIPDHHDVVVFDELAYLNDEPGTSSRRLHLQATMYEKPRRIGDGKVFRYWCRQFPDDSSSCFWVLSFYEHNYFIGFNGPFYTRLEEISKADAQG